MSGNQPPWGSPPGGAPGTPNPWGTPSQGGVPSQGGAPSPYSGQGPGGAPGMPPLSSPNPPPAPYAGQGPGGAPSPYAGQSPSGAPAPAPYTGQGPGVGSPSPYAAGQPPAPSPYGRGSPPSDGADPYAAFASAPGASIYGAGGAPPSNPYASGGAANPYANYATPASATGPTRSEVGGWLLLLCIGLTILVPLQMLSYVGRMMSVFGGFAGPFMMPMAVDLGIAAYSVYVGTGLWSKREKAVRHAKIYFGVRAGITVVQMFMAPGAFAVMQMNGPMGGSFPPLFGVFGTLAFCGVWFAYLNQSVRVRETYGSNN